MWKYHGLRAKTHSYLIDDHSEDRKAKGTKMCAIKRKLKFEDYKNCLEATELENKINHLENNETDVNSLKIDKQFIKRNKLILKTQQRCKGGSDKLRGDGHIFQV